MSPNERPPHQQLAQQADEARSQGDRAREKTLLEQALLMVVRVHGASDVAAADLLERLAEAVAAMGDARSSRKLLERAVVLKAHHYGEDAAEMTQVLVQLAQASGRIDDVLRETELLSRAMDIAVKHHGPHHLVVALIVDQLAAAWFDLGDPWLRASLLRQSCTIKQLAYAPTNPCVLQAHIDLAASLLYVGHLDQATAVVNEALPHAPSETANEYCQQLLGLQQSIARARTRRHVLVVSAVVVLGVFGAWVGTYVI